MGFCMAEDGWARQCNEYRVIYHQWECYNTLKIRCDICNKRMFKKIEVNVDYWWGIAGSGWLAGLAGSTKQEFLFFFFLPGNNGLNWWIEVRFEQNFAARELSLVVKQLPLQLVYSLLSYRISPTNPLKSSECFLWRSSVNNPFVEMSWFNCSVHFRTSQT